MATIEDDQSRQRDETKGSSTPKSLGINGYKIKDICIVMLVLSVLVYLLMILNSFQLQKNYDRLGSSTADYFSASSDARKIDEASDYLTDQVRLFSIELDRTYVDNYFRETKLVHNREKSLADLKKLSVETDTYDYVNKAIRYSNELMDTEYYAMRLIIDAVGYGIDSFPAELKDRPLNKADAALSPNEKIWKARIMLFDASYQRQKDLIRNNLSLAYGTMIESMRDVQRYNSEQVSKGFFRQNIYVTALFALTLIIFAAMLFLIAYPLNRYMEQVRAGQKIDLKGAYELRYLAGIYNSIFERNINNQEMLRHKSEHDPLTGLMNRAAFADISDMLRDNTNDVAMILIDVDMFKQINDKYGHDTGDKLLQKLAQLLQNTVRSSDNVFRLGDDEFGIILPYITPKEKAAIMDKFNSISDAMQHPMDGLPISSISVGAAFSSTGYHDALYLNADKALYQAKLSQKGSVNFYQDVL